MASGNVEDRWFRKSGRKDRAGRDILEKSSRWMTAPNSRYRAVWIDVDRQRQYGKGRATPEEAENDLARVTVAVNDGTYIKRHTETLAQFGDRYMALRKFNRPATRMQWESRWRIHIRPTLGHLPLMDITTDHIRNAVNKWDEVIGMSANSVEQVYGMTSTVLRQALNERRIPFSPCVGIILPEKLEKPIKPLTIDQIGYIADSVGDHYGRMVWIGAFTGLRPSELFGLCVEQITFLPDGTGMINVDRQLATTKPTAGPVKTGTSNRHVPIDEETVEIIKEQIAAIPPVYFPTMVWPKGTTVGSSLMFTTERGRPISDETAARKWRKARSELGIAEGSWHQLRHYNASYLGELGFHPKVVAERLGHKNAMITMNIYTKTHDAQGVQAAAVFGAAFRSYNAAKSTVTALPRRAS